MNSPTSNECLTVIRCRVSPGKIHEGDTYETLMRIIRESHETFGAPPMPNGGGLP